MCTTFEKDEVCMKKIKDCTNGSFDFKKKFYSNYCSDDKFF